MRAGKFCLVVLLSGPPAVVAAQPSVGFNVGVEVNDSYDSTAPGDPVASVDVFYDQLSPYGVWVDDPDLGRVFIPDDPNFVPYKVGHWQYTNYGFVWISSERFAWATSHYGRWAVSRAYDRWVWWPDTRWGPAWVEWRETDADFGWAPLAPEVYVSIGYQPPIESWHYCGAAHVFDADVTRYYEPRDRVVVIQRQAKPIEHYSNINNVRVVVGPGAAVLRDHRVTARPVKVEAHAIGRWEPAEAHAQLARAQDHKATFETQNQRRIEAQPKIREAHAKVLETHPAIKAQVTARTEGRAEPNKTAPQRVEPNKAPPPAQRAEPNRAPPPAQRPEPNRAPPPAQRVEPKKAPPPAQRAEPNKAPPPAQRAEPNRAPPPAQRPEPNKAPPPAQRAEPNRAPPPAQRPEPSKAPPAPPPAQRVEPNRAPPAAQRPEPNKAPPAPPPAQRAEPNRAPPAAQRPEPNKAPPAPPPAQRAEPNRAPPPAQRPEPNKAPPAQQPNKAPPSKDDKHDHK